MPHLAPLMWVQMPIILITLMYTYKIHTSYSSFRMFPTKINQPSKSKQTWMWN